MTTSNTGQKESWSRSSNDDDTDNETMDNASTVTIEERNEVEPDVINVNESTGSSENDNETSSENDITNESDGSEYNSVEALDIDEDDTVDETIDLAVMQVNYSVEERSDGTERAVIHVFCRDPNTKPSRAIRVDVRNFKPYFYTTPKDARKIDIGSDDRFHDIASRDDVYGEFESIRGKELRRVKAHIPRTVGQIRDDYEHFEADVLFPDRFLIDKEINSGIRVPKRFVDDSEEVIEVNHTEVEAVDARAKPRVHTVDIEVNDRNGFPEAEDAEEEILCITGHDSRFMDEYVVWYLDTDEVTEKVPDSVSGYEFIDEMEDEPNGSDKTIDIRTFDSETAMVADYIAYLDSHDPDILTGWNFDDFDATYLLNRMEYLNGLDSTDRDVSPDRLSRINEVWSGGWRGPNVKGRVVFDLLEAYKRTQFTELVSYRLEAVGQMELGVGKETYDGDIGDLWEKDPEQLIEYNIRDVEICVELDKQQEIIEFWNEVRQYVGCRIQDAPIPGDACDMYVLHKNHGRYVLPSKGEVESGEEFEGGAVFEPYTGIEDMVVVLDLKSLYPMSMTTINSSPETKVEDPASYDGETFVAPNGLHYEKEKDGIMREMIDELLSEREEKKRLREEHEPGTQEYELFDRQQASVKVIMNSLYGVTGWDRFRLYDKEGAAAVTATGRSVIDFTESVVNDLGYEVIYGDTDSVMISLGDDLGSEDIEISDDIKENRDDLTEKEQRQLQEAINKSFEIEEKINDAYDDYAKEEFNAEDNRFQIEFEKLYRRFIQAGRKKRYGGHITWKEGNHVDKVDITGFEYQRSDIAEITKESQKKLIEMLVRGEDLDDVKEYLISVIDRFKNGEIPVSKVGIPGGIGKELDSYATATAQVRGAKYANMLLGTNFQKGSKPKRVYLKRVDPSFYEKIDMEPQHNELYAEFKRDPDVICFIHDEQVPDEFEVDWEKMLDKTLQAPLSRVLKAVDLTWEDVKTGKTQTGLGQFMG